MGKGTKGKGTKGKGQGQGQPEDTPGSPLPIISWKRCGKHPTTLYCGENISGSEVEQGEGLVKCNKAGCETRWLSLQL